MDRHLVPRQMPTATGPADWREALEIVALGLPEQVVLLLTSQSPTTFSHNAEAVLIRFYMTDV